MAEAKYTTLQEFIESDDRDCTLYIDNDTVDCYRDLPDGKWTKLLSLHPGELMEEALDILGVKHEPV